MNWNLKTIITKILSKIKMIWMSNLYFIMHTTKAGGVSRAKLVKARKSFGNFGIKTIMPDLELFT